MITPEERLILTQMRNRGWCRPDSLGRWVDLPQEDIDAILDELAFEGIVGKRSDYFLTSKGLRELDES